MPLYYYTFKAVYIWDDKESMSGLCGGNQANETNMAGAKMFL